MHSLALLRERLLATHKESSTSHGKRRLLSFECWIRLRWLRLLCSMNDFSPCSIVGVAWELAPAFLRVLGPLVLVQVGLVPGFWL